MADPVKIPVKIQYDGTGFQQLTRDAQKAERAAMAATRQQVTARRNLMRLTAGLDKELAGQSGFNKLAGGFGVSPGALTGAAVGAGAAAAAKVTIDTARESIDLAREQAKVDAQLAAVLQSTGHAAGMTSFELKAMATQLQSVTNFGDETVQRGQNLLLTFTNIGRDVFPDATRAMLDMSEAMDQDVKQSAIQLGKALNDPVQGVGALRRVGVQFTDSQEELIKTMAESGNILGAQKMILAELQKEFGGSAEAARAADGGFQALSNAVGDLKEAIGRGLMPVTSEFNESAIKVVETLTGLVDGYNKTSKAVNDLHKEQMSAAPAWAQTMESTSKTALWLTPQVAIFDKLIQVGSQYLFNNKAIAEQIDETAAKQEEAAKAAEGLAAAQAAAAEAAKKEADNSKEAAKAAEELRKAYEKRQQIQRDAAREFIAIDEQALQDSNQAWDDWRKDISKLNSDTWKNLERIQADSAKRQAKIQTDLAKDLARVDKDLAKSLEQAKKDIDKRDRRANEDMARQDKRDRQRASIDALADERLFQFELRQMGAEGDAIGIQQALERRAIEEQIAAEKGQAEQQIEEEDRAIARQRQQEDDAERIRDLQDRAAERRAELEAAAAEETAAEELRRQEAIDAENESYSNRRLELGQFLDDKLASIDEGRAKAIEAIGRELAEAQELTTTELQNIAEAAGRIGEDAGARFAEGMNLGFRTNTRLASLLGIAGEQAVSSSSAFATPGAFGSSVPGFANGGIVPGPIGAPQLVIAHGGERITPPGQGVTINVNGVGADMLAQIIGQKVKEGVDEYDEYLSEQLN